MKKYLMTGIAALALCFGFTSCSHDVEPVSQEDLNNLEAQKVLESYNQAFIQAFGQPAANQDWGFGATRGITRAHADGAIDVNGNEWTKAPGVKIPEEVNAIYEYVKNGTEWMTANNKPFATTHPENLNGYFVTQVRNGYNADNAYTNDYKANTSVDNVGKWMNYLQIKFDENKTFADLANATEGTGWKTNGWEHINNFNASLNANHADSESAENGNTKVVEKGAFDFAYYNSLDHQFHNKWILVDGANISSDPYYADFYYVCFDFESTPNDNVTRISYSKKNDSGSWQTGYNAELPGTYYSVDEITSKLTQLPNGDKISDIKNIIINSYQQDDKMYPGDNKYTDWIIRITKGTPQNDYDGRIMAEDLTAKEFGDFDFNDVVFDYKLLNNGKAKIQLRAAGGTLELYVGGTISADKKTITGGREVHEAFNNAPVNQMINTGVTTEAEPATFEVDCADNLPVNIKIWVKKGDIFHELTAHTGQPASKFRTACTTKWCDEYISISNPYPTFKNWVNDTNFTEWTTTNFNEIFADKNLSNNEGAIKGRY